MGPRTVYEQNEDHCDAISVQDERMRVDNHISYGKALRFEGNVNGMK